MIYQFAIGKNTQPLMIDQERVIEELHQNQYLPERKGKGAVRYAMENPIGTPKLEEIVRPSDTVVIVTSDLTRPMPSATVLPPILEVLEDIGLKDEQITIVFALGSHRKQTEEEMRKLVGDRVYDRYLCVDGDVNDVVHMGQTRNGTPVDITRVVAEADRRICLGNIEYHYFAGYSGGAKAIMPGVSTREAIQKNHSKMVMEKSCAGNVTDNPVRDDLEEAISFCPIDYILNVVLDEKKEIVYAVAGDFIKAHRVGCQELDKIYAKPIPERADIVVVSQGGSPKDLNLYQTQKALDNAKYAVKDGGVIVLVGACQEGLGESVFEEWLLSSKGPDELIERIGRDFQLGGHKAAAIALVQQRASIYLVSEMEPDFVQKLNMTPFSTVQAAFDVATKRMGDQSTVILMPYGGSTLPRP